MNITHSHITEASLILHIKPTLTNHRSTSLYPLYSINHGTAENAALTSIFHTEYYNGNDLAI